MSADEFKPPVEKSIGQAELRMAAQLIDSMTEKWTPEMYKDDYREALEKVIEEKIEHGGKSPAAPRKRKQPSNVIDLVAVLQQSLEKTQAKSRTHRTPRRKAA